MGPQGYQLCLRRCNGTQQNSGYLMAQEFELAGVCAVFCVFCFVFSYMKFLFLYISFTAVNCPLYALILNTNSYRKCATWDIRRKIYRFFQYLIDEQHHHIMIFICLLLRDVFACFK